MKARASLPIFLFVCAPAAYLFGQVDCTTSTKLACEFPDSARTLAEDTIGVAKGSEQAVLSAAVLASGPFNASIAAQLTQLPIPSATVGTVYLKQKGQDAPIPYENLGPILTDRPDTVGKGHLFLGFSYQHFNFNALDSRSLGSLPAGFVFSQPSPSNPSDTQTFYGEDRNNVGFKLDQFVGVLTYGLTGTTDLSVIVPSNSVTLGVATSNLLAFFYDFASNTYTNISPQAGKAVLSSGSAAGLGDVTINVKHLFIGGEESRPAIAAGATFRFPSGDALNYLGSGAYGGSVYGLIEYRRRITPHLKLSYQWNGNSQVLDLTQAPYLRLPGGLQYAAGADVKVKGHYLTLAADVLGNQSVNTPSFAVSQVTVCPARAISGVCIARNPPPGLNPYTSVTAVNSTYSTANLSFGAKCSPRKGLLIYGNVLFQVNNVGLRSDPVPLVGIAYNFKPGSKQSGDEF